MGVANFLVDGMNVIGSRPDGWWRDRPGAMRALVRSLAEIGARSSDEFTVVFDGRPVEMGEASAIRVVFAPGGPNAADEELLRILRAEPDAGFRVVTSDTALAEAARAEGAEVVASGTFRRHIGI